MANSLVLRALIHILEYNTPQDFPHLRRDQVVVIEQEKDQILSELRMAEILNNMGDCE